MKMMTFLSSWKATLILSILTIIGVVIVLLVAGEDISPIYLINFFVSLCMLLISFYKNGKKKKPLFMVSITAAYGCITLFYLYSFCNYLVYESTFSSIGIHTISQISFYLFLFSAFYGSLDNLADDGSTKFRKYRLFACIMPAIVLIVIVILTVFNDDYAILVIGLCLVPLSYISLKQLIIPDIQNGFVRAMRSCNLVVLILVLVKVIELSLLHSGIYSLNNITMSLNAIVTLWIYPMANEGVKKWYQI